MSDQQLYILSESEDAAGIIRAEQQPFNNAGFKRIDAESAAIYISSPMRGRKRDWQQRLFIL